MDVTLLLKIAGVGMLAGVLCQVLKSSGKDEQASYVTLGGIIVVLLLLIGEITTLINTVRSSFGI
ncbi:MAG: stage III sporulation protein AC [Clostridia bacterium]|jgi:stage III sporulation protein AC|nr:stage III sporulation protein AC [Clostridia bacterium]